MLTVIRTKIQFAFVKGDRVIVEAFSNVRSAYAAGRAAGRRPPHTTEAARGKTMVRKLFPYELIVHHGQQVVATDWTWGTDLGHAYKRAAYVARTLAERAFDMAPTAYDKNKVWFVVRSASDWIDSREQEASTVLV